MKNAFFIVGTALILLLSGCSAQSITGKAVERADDTKEISIEAFQFGYTPDVINIKKGEKVRISIDNTDVMHGIRIPDLGVRGNETIEFSADKTGEFIWYCNVFCGEGHMSMKGKIIVK